MGLGSQMRMQQTGAPPAGYPAQGSQPPYPQQAVSYPGAAPGYPQGQPAFPQGAPPAAAAPYPYPQPAGGYPPQTGYPPQGGPGGGYPGYPPQAAPGGYPGYPPQQGGYPQGAPPMGQVPSAGQQRYPQGVNQGLLSVVGTKLQRIVEHNQLQVFYPPARLQQVVQQVATRVDFDALAVRWRMPKELAIDLASLALYDIVIYGDDSGSMESYDGERIDDLKLIMAKVAEVATLFDYDGIEVRFINSNRQGNGIKNASDAERLLQNMEYRYDTKLAAQMEAKILGPMAYSRRLEKPLLIITITDGEPSDKPKDKIVQVIQDCRNRLAPMYGPKAVAFQFAQVGRDQEAQQFLSQLDNHPQVGNSIDCTSYFELEQAEYLKKGIHLSVEAWLVKLMVGAVDPEYDQQDE